PPAGVAMLLTSDGVVQWAAPDGLKWQAATNHQLLPPGHRVRTGERSRASIRLSDRAVFQMGELSEMQVPAETADANATQGLFYFFLRDKKEFKVRTPSATAVLRGTEFNVEVAGDGRTILTMIDGEVDLANDEGVVRLSPGEQGNAAPLRPPEKSPVINANNVIQWCLYYPAILDPDDLPWDPEALERCKESLAGYREGDLRRALAECPIDWPAPASVERLYQAALLLSVGLVDEAESRLDESRIDRALRTLIAAVRFEELTGYIEPGNEAAASEWLAASYYLQSRGQLNKALACARAAVEKSPSFGYAWARRAELEFSFGQTRPALESVQRSLALSPRNGQSAAVMGFVLAAQNRIADAKTWFERAIELDGRLGNGWLGRGLCRIRQGQLDEGAQDLLVASALEPQRSLFRSYLGKAFQEQHEPDRALREIELARRLDPGDPTPGLYSALAKRQQNRINEAIRDIEQSKAMSDNRQLFRSRLLLDQDLAVRSANLAALYQDADMTEVAHREAARAVNANYANYSAHLFLANSYDAQRDPRQVSLRYETAWLNEYLLANLLAPVGAGSLSPYVSQQEYSRLFERNRFGLNSVTEYLSRGDWFQGGAQYGLFDNFSYALDGTYRSENGQRPNNDLEQWTLSLQAKQQLSPYDTLYLQGIYYEQDAGDVTQYYDPDQANRRLRTRETQEPILVAGYRHEWGPGSHTLALLSRMDDTLRVDDPDQASLIVEKNAALEVTSVLPVDVALDYRSQLEIYSGELQQILQSPRHTTVAGGRVQVGTFDTRSRQIDPSRFAFLFSDPAADQDLSHDFERFSLYGYHHWRIAHPLELIAGVAYDYVRYPANHRLAPLSPDEQHRDQVSPKLGLIYTPWDGTTLRGAYLRSVGGVSFDQSFQLEPSQVAGFIQSYRSLMPESVVGSVAAPFYETWHLSLEQRIGSDTYLGMAGEALFSDADREVGVFDLVNLNPPFSPSTTAQKLEFRERSLAVYANQLIGNQWVVGAQYRLSQAQLDTVFPEFPSAVRGASSHEEAVLQELRLFTVWNHPSGWFAELDGVWRGQDNQGYDPGLPDDAFWQLNAWVGCRILDRRADIRLGLLNITDKDYRLNPLNLHRDLPRDRTLVVRCAFSF
ncbi:MAG TPA: TonB-dependent receptor, partial [Candidatus Paceibacterota bacterium]|nr:TonB-dependent receptor [Candidatus Paceibacterota bacterium]